MSLYVAIYHNYHCAYRGPRTVEAKGVFSTFEKAVDFICEEAELDDEQREELEEEERIEIPDEPDCEVWTISTCEYDPGDEEDYC